MGRKKNELATIDPRQEFLKNSLAEVAGLSELPGAKAFSKALKDPEFQGMDMKCVAISCGLNLMDLAGIFKDGMLAETMLKVSEVISRKAATVVESTLDAACDKDATVLDKKLALEVCGLIGKDKSGINVNLNLNEQPSKKGSFVESAKAGTKVLEINGIPLEEE